MIQMIQLLVLFLLYYLIYIGGTRQRTTIFFLTERRLTQIICPPHTSFSLCVFCLRRRKNAGPCTTNMFFSVVVVFCCYSKILSTMLFFSSKNGKTFLGKKMKKKINLLFFSFKKFAKKRKDHFFN
jgi:hypothetical protein